MAAEPNIFYTKILLELLVVQRWEWGSGGQDDRNKQKKGHIAGKASTTAAIKHIGLLCGQKLVTRVDMTKRPLPSSSDISMSSPRSYSLSSVNPVESDPAPRRLSFINSCAFSTILAREPSRRLLIDMRYCRHTPPQFPSVKAWSFESLPVVAFIVLMSDICFPLSRLTDSIVTA
jgi:hypothetical protein